MPFAWPHLGLFKKQLAYALPFAGYAYLYVAQGYFSQYAVSSSFDAASFALFAVASFHMPVVDIVFTPLSDVMIFQIGKAQHANDARGMWRAWNDAVQKLASILFPAAACAWLFGPTVLPMLFTHKYDGSVPLFMLATLEIPLWILPLDALLRAAGETRFLFAFNVARIAMTAVLVLERHPLLRAAGRDRRRHRVGGAGARGDAAARAALPRRAAGRTCSTGRRGAHGGGGGGRVRAGVRGAHGRRCTAPSACSRPARSTARSTSACWWR